MSGEITTQSNGSKSSTDSNARSQRGRLSKNKQQKAKNPNSKVIHQTIHFIRNKVKAFKKEHLGARSKVDYVECSQCLEDDILPKWKMSAEKVKDYDEFLKLTLRKEVSEDVMSSDEYIDLISICKRAQAFEILVSDAKSRMLKCLKDHVYNSCGSLKEMAENELLIAVSEYDAKVRQHRLDTYSKLDELEENYVSYRRLTKPFSKFVRVGDEHTTMMNKVCNNLLEECKLVENWLKEDDQYLDKLVEEFECNKKIRHNLEDSLLQTEAKKNEKLNEIEKLKRSEVKAEIGYQEHRKDKLKMKARMTEMENKRNFLMDKIEIKRNEREDLKKAERQKSHMSPREASGFQERIGELDALIEKLDAERKKTERQMKKLEKDMKQVNDMTYEHKVDAVTFRHRIEEIQKDNKRLDAEMKSINNRISDIDANNDMLMRIRDMKLSTDVYRKFVRDKQKRDVSLSDGSQDLTDACKFAALYIGKDWHKVYLTLPFDPPRDENKRHRDMDIMDCIAARNDTTWNDQALKSLEKWRSFHRRGNVNELVQALRCVNKKQIANEIEHTFITSDT